MNMKNNSKLNILKSNNLIEEWSDLDKELLEICSNIKKEDYNQIIRKYNKPEITFALSPIRENCIEWLNITKTDTVLILGSGYGEVTGILSKRAKKVICIDFSIPKSYINEQRNNDNNNVYIYVSNINEFKEKYNSPQFDYIFLFNSLCNAFEYTEDSESPHKDLIEFAKVCTKDNGKIIVIEDNKYGIKFFDGTKGNENENYFQTFLGESLNKHYFSKKELVELFEDTKLNYKFYYPYPDYKFPMTIFSDDFLPEKGQLSSFESTWERDKINIFDQGKALEQMALDGLFEVWANSFIILISKKDTIFSDLPIYIKYSNERNRSLSICTQIYKDENGENYVIKKPSSKFSKLHLNKFPLYYDIMEKRFINFDRIHFQKCQVVGDDIKLSYIKGHSIMDNVLQWSRKGDTDQIVETFHTLYKYLNVDANSYFIKCKKFEQVFGNIELPRDACCTTNFSNIDLILPNIIIDKNNDWNIIDYEWVFDFPIPVKYILFRSIFYCFKQLGSRFDWLKEEIFSNFDINSELYNSFLYMEDRFQRYILGGSIPIRQMAQKDHINLFKKPAEIFYKIKEEAWSINKHIHLDNILELNHKLSLNIQLLDEWTSLRIDPTTYKCIIKINKICDGNGNIINYTTNGKKITRTSYFFNTNDPQIIINNITPNMKNLIVELELFELSNEI